MKLISQVVNFADIHAGCKLGLCPIEGVSTLDGGHWKPTLTAQKKMWKYWLEFRDEWIPSVTKGEPFVVVCNGDALNGAPHESIGHIDKAWTIQIDIAEQIIKDLLKNKNCVGYYHIAGTEAHVGKSGEYEELLAKRLGAIPDKTGRHARYELYLEIRRGKCKRLLHYAHHIGSASRAAYETSAVMAELAETFVDSARWGLRVPDAIIRAHRHRYIKVEIPTSNNSGLALTLPCWQLKTPFSYKIPGGRVTQPMLGGVLLRIDEEDLYSRRFMRSIARPKMEVASQ